MIHPLPYVSFIGETLYLSKGILGTLGRAKGTLAVVPNILPHIAL